MSGAVRRVLAGYALTSVANGLPWPLLLTLVFTQYGEHPHGAWLLGLAAAARMAPYVLLSWAVASLGDHVRRDVLVRLTMSLRVACLGATALAVETDRLGLAVLAAALAVTVGTPTYPAIAAALPRLAGEHRTRATQLLVTAEVSSWVVGPAIGGLLLAPLTRPYAVVVAVAMALVGRLLVVGVAMPAPAERATDAVAGMLRAVAGCRPALVALSLAAVTNVVETTVALTLLPMADTAAAYGVAVACLGAGALGAPLLCRLAGATTIRGLVLVAASIAVVALTPVPAIALPFLVLAGAAGVVVETVVTATLQDAVPDRYRAGALGVADTVMVASCLVATLAAPPLADLLGPRPLLLLTAVAAVVPLALVVRRAPATERERVAA